MTDFMPLDGWDHVELWVGNAKQSAFFYEHAFGFTPVAYAGPETGLRDRASYVLEQGEIRLVLTSGLLADHEISHFALAHGDGVKDIALTVPDVEAAFRLATERGATAVAPPTWIEDEHGVSELATIRAYGDTTTSSSTATPTPAPHLPGYDSRPRTVRAAATGPSA